MELHQLRSFVAVAEENSVTKAAERLYTTPPSVSVHVKTLEEELDVQLFERTPKGMVLTARGELLLTKAQRILQAKRDLVNHATEMQDHLMGTLSVGINATSGFLRIPSTLEILQTQTPGIHLDLRSASTGSILPALQSGALDAGFAFGPVSEKKPIATHRLSKVPLSIVAPASWRDRVQGVGWAALAQLPWIDSGTDCPFQAIVNDLFRERGLEYKRTASTHDESTRSDLVAAGMGLSLMIRDEISHRPAEEEERATGAAANIVLVNVAREEHEPITTSLSIVHAESRLGDPLLEALVDAVVAVWSSSPKC